MFKSCKDFVFLCLQTQHLAPYRHFTAQTGLWPRAGLGPQLAFKMWAKVTRAHCFCCCTGFLSSLKPSTSWYELLWGYKDHNKQPATRKMQGRGNKQKADHPIFWNWNLQGPKWQQDVNTLNPTVIFILSVFPLSDHVKRCQRFSQSKARFFLEKNILNKILSPYTEKT